MIVMQANNPRKMGREAQRAAWHRRHPEASIGSPSPKPPEESVERTRLIRFRDWLYKHILLCKKRGLLRHLSYQLWTSVFWTARKLWGASMWVRSAYQYSRWRLSRLETDSVTLDLKRRLCDDCDWRAEVNDVAYCDACNCPKVPRAAISRKNGRTYPHCSKGKHPGSRIDPYAKMKPCTGCGGRRKHGNTNLGR